MEGIDEEKEENNQNVIEKGDEKRWKFFLFIAFHLELLGRGENNKSLGKKLIGRKKRNKD